VRFTVVTPSFNQGVFIERAIESVLGQRGDFELEHLVVDGGSTDGTLAVLRRYQGRLKWISEKDRGQSDALNKGFRMASGEVLAWLNSDDTYLPGSLDLVARQLRASGARWCFGQCRIIDERDREIRRPITWYKNRLSRRYSLRRLITQDFVPQPAVFFRRDLLEQVGPIDESRHYTMDYDLWLRFGRVAEPLFLPAYLANFRWHGASKNGSAYRAAARESFEVARRHARPEERAALWRHRVHWASLVAVYGLLDLAARPLRQHRAADPPSSGP
jgi:glycosyltransferase involved in cell wall biosynthesis